MRITDEPVSVTNGVTTEDDSWSPSRFVLRERERGGGREGWREGERERERESARMGGNISRKEMLGHINSSMRAHIY